MVLPILADKQSVHFFYANGWYEHIVEGSDSQICL
jgi:hypothetical protein